jgi:hypothetical protein
MMLHRVMLTAVTVIAFGLPATARAQAIVFSDNFDTTPATNWNVNSTSATAGQNKATFGFDYSALGIPSAPHSTGGTTVGLKLEANTLTASPAVGGVSVSPNTFQGSPFTGIPAGATNYTVQFDLWQNFNGPFPGGGTGSTQHSGGGIGVDSTTPQYPGTPAAPGTVQGVTFLADADGGSSATSTTVRDYVAYKAAGSFTAPGVTYAATSATPQDNADPYYGGFGNLMAPPAQQTAFPQQTGSTAAGAPAFAWHTWQITKNGNTVTWTMDNLPIATADVSDKPFAGTNFFLGQFDFFASVAPTADQPVLFGLFDNVIVTTPVPEPSSLALVGLAVPVLLRLRRRKA